MQHPAIYDPRASYTPSQREAALAKANRLDRIVARSHPDSPVVCLSASLRGGLHVKRELKVLVDDVAMKADQQRAFGGPQLDDRRTFESFVVGNSNLLAYTAAQQAASANREHPAFNPLLIHAGPGLGKSHLLHAVANASEHRCIYMTGERFVANVAARAHMSFVDRLGDVDVVLIDDIQQLKTKDSIAALNTMIDFGYRVMLTSDRPPIDIDNLDERLQSRVAGGLVVEIAEFGEDVRSALLLKRVEAAQIADPTFEILPEAVQYLTINLAHNGREIDGAINRLAAFSGLGAGPITVEQAEQQLRDLVRTPEPKRIKIEDIQRVVGRRYHVARNDLLSIRRTAKIVRPRQIAMYLAKMLTMRSLPEIGRRFGGRDHTTVLHAVRKIAALIDRDPMLKEECDSLEKQLSEA